MEALGGGCVVESVRGIRLIRLRVPSWRELPPTGGSRCPASASSTRLQHRGTGSSDQVWDDWAGEGRLSAVHPTIGDGGVDRIVALEFGAASAPDLSDMERRTIQIAAAPGRRAVQQRSGRVAHGRGPLDLLADRVEQSGGLTAVVAYDLQQRLCWRPAGLASERVRGAGGQGRLRSDSRRALPPLTRCRALAARNRTAVLVDHQHAEHEPVRDTPSPERRERGQR